MSRCAKEAFASCRQPPSSWAEKVQKIDAPDGELKDEIAKLAVNITCRFGKWPDHKQKLLQFLNKEYGLEMPQPAEPDWLEMWLQHQEEMLAAESQGEDPGGDDEDREDVDFF